MKFAPRTEEDLNAEAAKRGAWAPGVYDAEIATAVEKVSNAGNDMIEVSLNVFHPEDGSQKQMRDWLLEAVAYKLRHACEAAGVLDAYEAGSLDAWQLEGKPVKVKVGTETFKRDDGSVGTKNKVLDYVVSKDAQPRATPPRKPAMASAPKQAGGGTLDDDIPFAACKS